MNAKKIKYYVPVKDNIVKITMEVTSVYVKRDMYWMLKIIVYQNLKVRFSSNLNFKLCPTEPRYLFACFYWCCMSQFIGLDKQKISA